MDEQAAHDIVQAAQWPHSGLSAQSVEELRESPDYYEKGLLLLPELMALNDRAMHYLRTHDLLACQVAWNFSRSRPVFRELTQTPTEPCWKCKGEQEVVSYYSGTGFAGGRIYHTELACGHYNADESDDVRAAR